ncbi:MAG: TlpA family protein disulfide reductase [Clostridium sp.]
MNEKKRTLVILVIFVGVLISGAIAYNYFSKEYKEKGDFSNSEFLDDKVKPDVKVEAKDFLVYDKDGNEVRLSDYKGKKAVVINFWASWCTPCKIEMGFFQNATDKYKGKDVEILMVNLTDGSRETKEKAQKFLKEEGYDLNVMFDSDMDAAMRYYIQAIPRTIFVNKDGTIYEDHTGIISQDILDDRINKMLQ